MFLFNLNFFLIKKFNFVFYSFCVSCNIKNNEAVTCKLEVNHGNHGEGG